MTPDGQTREIETIEEMALFSIERTDEGLSKLASDIEACADQLINSRAEGLKRLPALAEKLRDFDVFEHHVCSSMDINRRECRDEHGNLENHAAEFRKTLDIFAREMESNNLENAASLLRNNIPQSLLRFKELLPLLKYQIEKNTAKAEDEC